MKMTSIVWIIQQFAKTIRPANIIKNDVDVNEDSNNYNDENKIITM